MTRCANCPVDPGRPCVGELAGWAWPCEFAAMGETHRRHIVARSALEEAKPAPLPTAPLEPEPERLPKPPSTLGETLRLTMLARKCPYRSPPSCSCSGAAACALTGLDVPAKTCWDCVARYGA